VLRARSSVRIERSPAEAEVAGSSPAERATVLRMRWYVYVLKNERGRSYVGSTGRPPELRLAEHNAGLNRWTRAHGPWRLVYWETHDDKGLALARERFLKTGAGRRVRDGLVDSVLTGGADSSFRIESA
jgi:putative endonuclease